MTSRAWNFQDTIYIPPVINFRSQRSSTNTIILTHSLYAGCDEVPYVPFTPMDTFIPVLIYVGIYLLIFWHKHWLLLGSASPLGPFDEVCLILLIGTKAVNWRCANKSWISREGAPGKCCVLPPFFPPLTLVSWKRARAERTAINCTFLHFSCLDCIE